MHDNRITFMTILTWFDVNSSQFAGFVDQWSSFLPACATLCISGKPFSNGLNTGNMQKNISQYQLDIAAYLLEKLMALCNRLWRISGLMTD